MTPGYPKELREWLEELRRRIFKKEGRSRRWKEAKKETEEAIEEAKKLYFNRMKEKALVNNNSKSYFQAVCMLSGKEAPKV